MKRMIFLAMILNFCAAGFSFGQTSNTSKKPATNQAETTIVKLPTSTTANAAYGDSARQLSISDPTINALNQQALGNRSAGGRSGIIGMPRGSYGFANGKLLLRPTTATSSGTNYGSGSVATGTTITGIGTGENTPGINGKNPYAGISLWGVKPSYSQTSLPASTRRQ